MESNCVLTTSLFNFTETMAVVACEVYGHTLLHITPLHPPHLRIVQCPCDGFNIDHPVSPGFEILSIAIQIYYTVHLIPTLLPSRSQIIPRFQSLSQKLNTFLTISVSSHPFQINNNPTCRICLTKTRCKARWNKRLDISKFRMDGTTYL